jgi:hypothetical protein
MWFGVNMQLYQERVVAELRELEAKLEKLRSFISSIIFKGLALGEQVLLHLQAEYMGLYAGVLRERIESWG